MTAPTPAKTTPAYVPTAGDARRDRDAVLAVWRGSSLGREERLATKYDWFYLGCPFGQPALRLLRHEASGAIVGTAAAGPRRMLREGKELRAGVIVDMAVTTEHRSLGPAVTVLKSLMAAGEARFDLLYGFPNQKAVSVFKRVGYDKLGEIVRYARVLRYEEHLARLMSPAAALPLGLLLDGATAIGQELRARRASARELAVSWSDSAVPEMDELWARSAHGDETIAVRDAAMLRWRFDEAPVPKTRYLLVKDSRTGSLSAWFACQVDGRVMHVRDFWSVDATEGVGQRFIDALLRAARRAGHAVVSVEQAGPAVRRAAWLDAGFMERGRRPVYGKWKKGGGGGGELHLTSADEDE